MQRWRTYRRPVADDVERPVADHEHWTYLRVTEVDHGGVVLWGGLAGDVEDELVNESWRDD